MSTPYEIGLLNEPLQDAMTQINARKEEERQKVEQYKVDINKFEIAIEDRKQAINECVQNIQELDEQYVRIKSQYDKNHERAIALNTTSGIRRSMSPLRTHTDNMREIRYLRSRLSTLENRMR